MSGGFSFPPPPPPPPRQASDGPQQTHQPPQRGGRGGRPFNVRGRGAFRGRGGYSGGDSGSFSHQSNANAHPAPYNAQNAQWSTNMNDWAAQQAQNMMAMYGMHVVPTYAQSLPGFAPASYSPSAIPASSLDAHNVRRSVAEANAPSGQRQGEKRKREVVPRVPAAPAVPSFGGPMPQWQSASPASVVFPTTQGQQRGDTKSRKKKKAKNNQLGLNPNSETHDSDGDDDDVDEEAAYGANFQNGAISVTHGNETTVLASAADIKAWLSERRKKFPTKARAEMKKQEDTELRKERDSLQRQFKEKRTKHHEADMGKDELTKDQSQQRRLEKKPTRSERRDKQQQDRRKRTLDPDNDDEQRRLTSIFEGRRLYVGNIPNDTSEADLDALFGDYNPELMIISRKRGTAHSSGHAFVDVSTCADAQRAIAELNEAVLGNQKIAVSFAKEPKRFAHSTEASLPENSRTSQAISRVPNGKGEAVPETVIGTGEPVSNERSDAEEANDKSCESVMPSTLHSSKPERLEAKAENYRKLAEKAEIAALEAKAQALGYNIVKTEAAQTSSPSYATKSQIQNSETEQSKEASSDAFVALHTPTETTFQTPQPIKEILEPDSSVKKNDTMLTEPLAHQYAPQEMRLPGLQFYPNAIEHPEVDAMIQNVAQEAAAAAVSHRLSVPSHDSAETNAIFTVDTSGDTAMKLDDVNEAFAKSLQRICSPAASSVSLSDSESSSPSDSSESSNSSDDSSEAEAEQPELEAAPVVSNASLAQHKKPCQNFLKTGQCRFGEQCRFSHDLPVQQRRAPMKAKRMTLRERLIEKEDEERRKLVVGAIKFLGDRGLLDADSGGQELERRYSPLGESVTDEKGGRSKLVRL